MHRNQTAPTAGTVNATTVAEPPSKLPHKVPQEQVRMDADPARDPQEVDSPSTACRNSDVQVEIEQRWHQVETTPLREEKRVPITGSSNVPVGERALPQKLSTALEKEARNISIYFLPHFPSLNVCADTDFLDFS